MKKTYVLDTNVLLSDPNALFSFDDMEQAAARRPGDHVRRFSGAIYIPDCS